MSNTFKILIEDIENAEDKILRFEFDEKIDEIKSKTPLKANVELKSLGEFINVKATCEVTVLLECDRCLKEFEYSLSFEIDETFVKNSLKEEYSQEMEIKETDFVSELYGEKEIDIYDLLYQSVILNLPNRKVCGINCNEGVFKTDEEFNQVDPRMEVFKNIKIDKK